VYAGRALRALGARGVVVARCGAGERRELLAEIVPLGLPVHCGTGHATTAFAFEYDGEARHMRVERVGDEWTPDDAASWVAEALADVEWVHVAPLLRSDFPVETLARLARGRRLLLDGQGLVRVPEVGPLRLDADFDPDVLRHVSVVKLAEEEVRVLVEGVDERALRALGVPEVVVTLGSSGCVVFADGLTEHVPATATRGPVDPTGAGDAFAVAYVAARSGGAPPAAAARRASALVAAVLSQGRRR
jgi:sugar/nucleoside kinase (ribokinase family)